MNVNTNFNYLTNSLSTAKRFAGDVANTLRENIYQSKYGYNTKSGSAFENLSTAVANPAKTVATAVGDVLTNTTQKQIWKYTNVPRMAGELGAQVAKSTGLDPVTGTVMVAAAPLALMTLSNVRGPISQGLRPSGYKAVAPKSKEEDPTGRTPQSVPLEFALRAGLGMRSSILPYQEFSKERPDVHPSTYVQYRRYENSKPQPGQLVAIDPEGQSFTTVGGLVRGTAKGLNDPEVRIKGMPVTFSGVLGTAAGLATTAALHRALPKEVREARMMQTTSFDPETLTERARIQTELSPIEKKHNQLQQIVKRVQTEMTAKGVTPLDKYGVAPDDQAAKRVYQEAINLRSQLNTIQDDLKRYTYAHGRATGKIPHTQDDPHVEHMMAKPYDPNNLEIGGMGMQSTKSERSAAQRRQRIINKLDPEISFSAKPENIAELETEIQGLNKQKESLLQGVKQRLTALNIPEETLSLQDRMTRAKVKASEVSEKVKGLQEEFRTTFRPTNVPAPSTATVAGLALAGTAAAVGTAYVARKLMQKSAERRIKKENPVEYLKHKHGSLDQAKAALQQPEARSWQDLTSYV